MAKAKFVRSIGRCLVNNVGFDLYENPDKTATIRPVKLTRDLPTKYFRKFDSLESAEAAIDSVAGDTKGAQRVYALQKAWLKNSAQEA